MVSPCNLHHICEIFVCLFCSLLPHLTKQHFSNHIACSFAAFSIQYSVCVHKCTYEKNKTKHRFCKRLTDFFFAFGFYGLHDYILLVLMLCVTQTGNGKEEVSSHNTMQRNVPVRGRNAVQNQINSLLGTLCTVQYILSFVSVCSQIDPAIMITVARCCIETIVRDNQTTPTLTKVKSSSGAWLT